VRISVVIPCHNAGPWIAGALQSVVAQKFPPHEIIVIDDNSTDDSLEQVQKSGATARVLRVKEGNAAAARNAGIQAATGDWIALLDADDVWYPQHLARAVELLSKTSDVAFMSNHDWLDLNGKILPLPDEFRCKLTEPRRELSMEDFYGIQEQGFHFGHSTVLYRRGSLLKAGLFDPAQKRRHDLDLWLRMLGMGTWTYDTVNGAGYRLATPGSISSNELECDYYELRALVKNSTMIKSPLHRKHLSRKARRAMGIAFVDRTPGHYARIRELAWPYLPWEFKICYLFGETYPRLLRWLIKTKRSVIAVR
jgi:succinoglycan biosynthesis protein ExoO